MEVFRKNIKFSYDKIPIPTIYTLHNDQSMNIEYMTEVYKTNIHYILSSLWVKAEKWVVCK